jgi:LacI family transcriptional regulator
MSRTTLKDIAEKVGVSVTAVSRALSGYPDISEETRNRIFRIAEELNYQPNIAARTLVTQKSGVLGLFVLGREKGEGFSHPFSGQVINGFLDGLVEQGYDMMVFKANRPPDSGSSSYIGLCRRRMVEGAFLMGLRTDDPWITDLKSSSIPIVTMDMPLAGEMTFSVGCDNVSAVHAAVRHLADLGHTRISIVNGYTQASVSLERFEGYRSALDDLGLPFDPSLVAEADFTVAGGKEAFLTMIDRTPDITAVFAASDLMALGVLEGARELGLRVPKDLSVVGFDNIDMASMSSPPLTTLDQPRYELGRTAAKILISACNGDTPPSRVLLKANLIVRGSTSERNKGKSAKGVVRQAR